MDTFAKERIIRADLARLLSIREAELKRLLDAIPECPCHGKGCIPHALEWIEKMKEAVDLYLAPPSVDDDQALLERIQRLEADVAALKATARDPLGLRFEKETR